MTKQYCPNSGRSFPLVPTRVSWHSIFFHCWVTLDPNRQGLVWAFHCDWVCHNPVSASSSDTQTDSCLGCGVIISWCVFFFCLLFFILLIVHWFFVALHRLYICGELLFGEHVSVPSSCSSSCIVAVGSVICSHGSVYYGDTDARIYCNRNPNTKIF